jgi:uncharacterized membrane protein YGL010W
MRPIKSWLDEYGESHKSKANKTIHWICIPSIIYSLLGLFWLVSFAGLLDIQSPVLSPWANLASLVFILALVYYLRLSFPLTMGMLLIVGSMLLIINYISELGRSVLALSSVIIFVLAWIGQFIGHNIEGKKPSFFKDLQFLLIGPAWLLSFIYEKMGIKY